MAIQVSGTTVIDNSRNLTNIASVDAATAAAIGAAGVGGGGTIDVTASGAITAGDIVGVNSDGTVSTIGEIMGDAEHIQNPTSANKYGKGVATNGNGTYLFTYVDYPTYYVKAVAGTFSGGSFTFGTPVTLHSSNSSYYGKKVMYDPTHNCFIVANVDNNGYPYLIACTVSGTTITAGSAVQVSSYTTTSLTGIDLKHDPDVGNNIFSYMGSGGYLALKAFSVSGTTMSFGSEVLITNTDVQNNSMAYDTTNNQWLAVGVTSSGGDMKAIRFTLSGTTITVGTTTTYNQDGYGGINAWFNTRLGYSSTANAFLLTYDNGYNAKYGTVLTISGTTPVWSRYDNFYIGRGGTQYGDLVEVSGDFYYLHNEESSYFTGIYITKINIVDSDNIQSSVPVPLNARHGDADNLMAITSGGMCYDASQGKFVICAQCSEGEYISATAYNITKSNFDRYLNVIGIAAENISNAATGSVTVTGGVNESVSGLTTGAHYYIDVLSGGLTNKNYIFNRYAVGSYTQIANLQNDITYTQYKPFGVALSATKFLITDTLR